jgi:hypothetical protein
MFSWVDHNVYKKYLTLREASVSSNKEMIKIKKQNKSKAFFLNHHFLKAHAESQSALFAHIYQLTLH